MREILLIVLYFVNQKAPKTIESTLIWEGPKPTFYKYLIVAKIDTLALTTRNEIPLKNKSCSGHCPWKSLMSTSFDST